MPLGKIVGVLTRSGSKKDTGEYWESIRIYYTYNVREKGMAGYGADNVRVNLEKFNMERPELGAVYLIEKDADGWLENIELVSAAEKKDGNK